MRMVPGVRIVPLDNGRSALRFARNPRANCPPQYFVDGIPTSNFDIDEVLPGDVEGVELYPGSAGVPPQFNRFYRYSDLRYDPDLDPNSRQGERQILTTRAACLLATAAALGLPHAIDAQRAAAPSPADLIVTNAQDLHRRRLASVRRGDGGARRQGPVRRIGA